MCVCVCVCVCAGKGVCGGGGGVLPVAFCFLLISRCSCLRSILAHLPWLLGVYLHVWYHQDEVTLLHSAALEGHEEVVKVLLAAGASINALTV